MFWEKAYIPSQNIEALLQKEDLKLEELLEDDDILQECKSQPRNLVQYLTRPDVIKRLIELITTEPPEDLPLAQRFRHAHVAYDVLTFGLPSLSAKIVGDPALLKTLYSFLEQEPPLNPLLSSFFCKTFGMLIFKTYDRDWFLHQKMCLQVVEFIKDQGNFLDLIFKHSATPVITDLLLQITNEFKDLKLKKDVYDWLAEQQLVERLITTLGQPEESEKHNNIAELLCELIKHGRLLKEDEIDSWNEYEAFGDNSILKTIESETTLNLLLDVMLKPNAKESTIVAGISVILALIDEAVYEKPASDNALRRVICQKKNNKQIISTVIEVIAPRIKDFHDLLLNLNNCEKEIVTTAGKLCPPFGYTRLQICHLLTELTALGHDVIIVEICNIDYFSTLLKLFKQYTWNNFLHKEVEKFFIFVFSHLDPPVQPGGQKRASLIQSVALIQSNVISKLVDCWYYFPDEHSSRPPRRLGYMGHLINIFDKILSSMSESNLLGALLEATLSPEDLEKWKKITNPLDGELKMQLQIQNKMLADCNVHENDEYGMKQNMALDDDMRDFGNRAWHGEGVFEPSIDDLEADWSCFALADMDELIRAPYDLEKEALDNMINRNGPFGDSPEPQDSFQAFANSSSCVVPPGDPFSVPNCTNSNSTIPEPESMFNCFDDEDSQEFATDFDINLVPEQSFAENTITPTPIAAPSESAAKDTSSGAIVPTQSFVESEKATTTTETSSSAENIEQSGSSDSIEITTEAATDSATATTTADDSASA